MVNVFSFQPLQIKSVVAKEGLKGYIYIEAFKQTHVKQAIEGIGSLTMGLYKQQVRGAAQREGVMPRRWNSLAYMLDHSSELNKFWRIILFCPQIFLLKIYHVFNAVKQYIGHILKMVGPIDMKQEGLIGIWIDSVALTFDLPMTISRSNFEMWNAMEVNRLDGGLAISMG